MRISDWSSDVCSSDRRIHQATAKASGNAGYEPGFRSLAVHPQSSLLCVRPQPDAAWLRCQLWSGYMKLRTTLVKGMVHVMPPSTSINIPLTKEASSDARNSAAAATSSGVPTAGAFCTDWNASYIPGVIAENGRAHV